MPAMTTTGNRICCVGMRWKKRRQIMLMAESAVSGALFRSESIKPASLPADVPVR